jgi:iron(III) transport system substrate-binding protein
MGIRTKRAAELAVAGLMTGLLTLGLAACGADGQDDTAAAGAESESDKKITLYSGREEKLVKPLLEKFEKATGITVEVRYGDTAQMAAQLLEEGDRSPADVFLAQDAGALGAVTKKELFAALPTEVLERVAPAYRAKGGQWVGVTGRSRVLVYNADQVTAAQLPASVLDLTGPAWKGKVGVAPTNGSFQAFVTALRVQHGDERTKEFLSGLAANQPQIREKNGAIVSDVNAGKIAVGLVNHYYVYQKAAEAGVGVDAMKAKLHFFPDGDTGALVNVSGVGLLSGAASDPDAKAFVDYLLGSEAQTYFAEETFEYPMVSGVEPAPGLPALTSLEVPKIDLNDLDTLDATVAMIKESGLV